jgi:ribosomal protein S18 acetylase RimI-like enzyme
LVDIREVRPAEWRSLKRLRLRALKTDPDAFGRTLDEERAQPDTAWQEWAAEGWGLGAQATFVAVDGDRWLGIGVCVIPRAETRTATVFAMWVDPSARRRGVGQQLLRALTEWASSREAEELLLEVIEGNTGALSLYEGAGFNASGKRAVLRPDSKQRTISMHKPLTPERGSTHRT